MYDVKPQLHIPDFGHGSAMIHSVENEIKQTKHFVFYMTS